MTAEAIKEGFEAASAPPPEVRERYHSLDFLRGSLMLLGIAFHAALPYDDLSPWIKDAPLSAPLGTLALGIHAFRMPIFFVLAGFFAALTLSRRSPLDFVGNRGLRIGIPLLVGWAVLPPLVSAGTVFAIAANFTAFRQAFDSAWELLKEGDFFFKDDSMHLWFLYYLLLFYAVLLAVRGAIESAGGMRAQEGLSRSFVRLLESPLRLPVLTIVVFALAQLIEFPNYENPQSFTPDPRLFAYYGAFFAFGCVLFSRRGVLNSFGAGAWLNLMLAIVALGALRLAVAKWSTDEANIEAWTALGRAATALAICGLLFSSVGLLQRYLNRPLPVMRYVADASYWCYLIHLPLVVWMPGLLVKQDWPSELKFGVVLIAALTICLLTYELFVRWTYVGTVLQGRRYPSVIRVFRRREAPAITTANPTSA